MKTQLLACIAILAVSAGLAAQTAVTWTDYENASNIRNRYQGLTFNEAGTPTFVGKTSQFWYRRSVDGGAEFILADAKTAAKKPAFDHTRLAAGLSTAAKETYTALTLPFTTFTFADDQKAITFNAKNSGWRCDLGDYTCKNTGPATLAGPVPRANLRQAPYVDMNGDEVPNEDLDERPDAQLYPQQGRGGRGGAAGNAEATAKTSPDGKWEALVRNYNVFVRAPGKTEGTMLSTDGSENNSYTFPSIAWSPDSKHIAAYRVRPATRHQVHYTESSPTDQIQPKHFVRDDPKPGDAVDLPQPVLFDVAARKQYVADTHLFPNPYSLTPISWRKDSRAFTFEYNERGHQTYRVIEVNAGATGMPGAVRALIEETSKTFITYSQLSAIASGTGGRYIANVNDGKEIVWLSERDGWAHLYLYDGVTGKVKNQITKGEWVVRFVDKVDDDKRQIWFRGAGMYPGKDPYFTNAYRINFDGTGLTRLTEGDGNHVMTYSSDMEYLVDTWSRVDMPPVTELRSAQSGKLIATLETADITKLKAAGWSAPDVFVAPGRDGKTEIWGLIFRPRKFDPNTKYPVVEAIYAGPQGSFVPKSFGAGGRGGAAGGAGYAPNTQVLTELGFIVVQIDGMGTANRSRAFHDVAFKNIGDAGFPDRIAWMKAAAAKYPYMDISRVGVYGTSAGGQNALGALLFHGDFYKVAMANSGCHDNRMDKIWWNEQWMSWPVDESYSRSSNVDNAWRLKGKLQLVVPELDTNVDPSSTFQVVNALMKANKKFDLLVVPGADHGASGRFGQRLMFDFFVHNLHGAEPPEWQAEGPADVAPAERVSN